MIYLNNTYEYSYELPLNRIPPKWFGRNFIIEKISKYNIKASEIYLFIFHIYI